ncbi:MAG: hypothetical protein CXR31_00875 [Geobacter sp.]|nr:MAG: hypothetical protein CXR31_00875 [Geobacter sp.]
MTNHLLIAAIIHPLPVGCPCKSFRPRGAVPRLFDRKQPTVQGITYLDELPAHITAHAHVEQRLLLYCTPVMAIGMRKALYKYMSKSSRMKMAEKSLWASYTDRSLPAFFRAAHRKGEVTW